jgi:1,2-diacylglycerol 3-alpha-glucosyltransferase
MDFDSYRSEMQCSSEIKGALMFTTVVERETEDGQLETLERLIADTAVKSDGIRIGIFTDGYPPVVNGVSTSVHTLVEQLEKAGHKVFVFAPRFPGYTESQPNVVRFPSFITPFDKRYPLPMPFSRELFATLRRLRLDIVHSQSPFVLGLIALELSRRNRIPLVATNHTLYLQYTHYVPFVPKPVISAMARKVIGWYYRSCEGVITPSRMAATQLIDLFSVSTTPVHVIPSGVPIPAHISGDVRLAARRRLGVPADSLMLLYCGRLAREKNLMMLLDAFEFGVLPKFPTATLVLAGSGPDADDVTERVNRSPELVSRVSLPGFINRDELDPIYATADLFVFPSKSETQGMVSGEALAVGTPCVVVNEGGAPETVTDGIDGLLAPDDPVLFAEAINRILGDPELRRKMGQAGIATAIHRTPERMASQVISIYEDAIKQVKLHGPRSMHTYRNIGFKSLRQMLPTRRLWRRR